MFKKSSPEAEVEVLMAKKMVKNPCWKGYRMFGMKTKNGRRVPNCVKIRRNR